MTSYLRTPGQASNVYRLGSPSAARPKGLFFVRFRRAVSTMETDTRFRGDDFGFVVKSLDQPKVSIKTEELSQYNKKRQVHTAYEVAPLTITLIDTMDGTARKLWQSYLGYYFGDFRHDPTALDWSADEIKPMMNGYKTGYGLVLPPDDDGPDARYFFNYIDIFQVYAGAFTKTTLINPRITSFDPDELDYEQMTPSTFRMQITYETLQFQETTGIASDPEIMEIFGDPTMLGGNPLNTYDPDPPLSQWTDESAIGRGGSPLNAPLFGGGPISIPDIFSDLVTGTRAGAGGVLGALGNLNFGSMAATAIDRLVGGGSLRKGNLASELVYAGTNNAALAGIIQRIEGPNSKASLLNAGVNLLQRANPSSNPVVYDAARALIASQTGNKAGAAFLAGNLVKGVLGAAKATGTAPSQHVQRSSAGMSLSQAGLALTNLTRSPTAKYGKRTPPTGRS